MSGNRSLDEFAGTDDAEEDGLATEEEPDGESADDEQPAESAIDPGVDRDSAGDDAAGGVVVDAEMDDATGSASGADRQPDASHPDDDDGSAGPTAEAEPVERPASTYCWSPDGAACADCGEAVEERWRDGDDLVCSGCKEW